jgi:hypothetical protein
VIAGTNRSSPLDGQLVVFLQLVANLEDGYRPIAHAGALAEKGGWHPAFSTVLFDSARARRLIEPYQPRRNVTRWRISKRGKSWLAERAPPDGEEP